MKQLVGLIVIAAALAACNGSSAPPASFVQATAPPVTAEPVVEPTQDPVVSSGIIEFGTGVNDAVEITGKRDTFKRTAKKIAWVAHLSEPAGAASLTWTLSSRSASGSEQLKQKTTVDMADPNHDTLGNAVNLPLLVNNKAGTYVMRYLRGGDVLAEGEFKLVK